MTQGGEHGLTPEWISDEFFWDGVFNAMLTSLASNPVTTVGGLAASARSFAAMAAHRLAGPTIVVTPTTSDAEKMRDDLAALFGRVLYFPAYETLPWEGEPAHPGVVSDRVECMAGLLTAGAGAVAVVPAAALLKKLPVPESFSVLRLYRGMRISMESVEEWLLAAGYLKEGGVWEQGRWARRGGILDIASYGLDNPVRLEFFGDELESVRFFDQRSQRSIRRLQECILLPAREVFLSPDHWNRAMETVPESHPLSERLWTANDFPGIEHYLPVFLEEFAHLPDYLPESGTLIISDPDSVAGNMEKALDFQRESCSGADLPFAFHDQFFSLQEVTGRISSSKRLLRMEPFPTGDVDVYYRTFPQDSFVGHRDEMVRQLREWSDQGVRIAVVSDSEAEMTTFAELLPDDLVPGQSVLNLSEGFRMPEPGLAVLVERGLLSTRRRPERVRRFRGGEGLSDASDISPGELVVHARYGIGRFTGLEKVETSGTTLDCLAIEYRDGDRLLVPMDEIGSVQRYLAPDRADPTLDRIGGVSWGNRISKARKQAQEIAGRLAALYAERRIATRVAFEPPGHHVTALAGSFPYEETRDQARAIEAVMGDFEGTAPMDRLVCGDVGYGKTEVAVRAAFRAVDAGYQVAVLVPTTVLAEQHYFTFRDRLAEFPVAVDVLSRFRGRKEQARILASLSEGETDIIIGTHRLLQKDVRFNRLGLVVVDEEHRFGVRQKEYLRELKTGVDTLAMTATPIPRTLHMALSGFRNISLITTPPRDRYPIHTELLQYNAGIIARAVKRELERDGQVFFVHNRIKTIERVREKLQSILPDVRMMIGHGQMSAGELEEVMHSFMEGHCDILLSTAIIESGLDLPRVNTMFIDNAHMFGLAELYQLRGRVGRSHHQAYCYLIVPDYQKLQPEARERLDTIRRFTELGSGWNIAMRDLEIRGAGELLGASQHGQMISIGYSMFEELIRQEAARIKGDPDPERMRTVRIEIPGDSFIPADYVPDIAERVRIYRVFWRVGSEEEIDDWTACISDRYGEPDRPVLNCATRARLHYLALSAGAEEVVVSGQGIRIVFPGGVPVPGRVRRQPFVRCIREKTGRTVLSVSRTAGSAGLSLVDRAGAILRLFEQDT